MIVPNWSSSLTLPPKPSGANAGLSSVLFVWIKFGALCQVQKALRVYELEIILGCHLCRIVSLFAPFVLKIYTSHVSTC